MEVRVSDLRSLAEKLLVHVQECDGEVVIIDHDYYWAISQADRYEPYKEPQEFTMGQISDDLRELDRIRSGESEPIGYALVWLSSVLRAVGERATC